MGTAPSEPRMRLLFLSRSNNAFRWGAAHDSISAALGIHRKIDGVTPTSVSPWFITLSRRGLSPRPCHRHNREDEYSRFRSAKVVRF
jgi:hypothetical protein